MYRMPRFGASVQNAMEVAPLIARLLKRQTTSDAGSDDNDTDTDNENDKDNVTLAFSTRLLQPTNSTVGLAASAIESQVQIPLYSVIFLLSVIGNSLVILTLAQNKHMRTVTNIYLLNLAVSDLLLGVVCMPFTLIGTLLRDFVFGKAMCRLIPYLQVVLVSVSAWTLVVISVERYYAICHPLVSRRWQTLSHARRIIVVTWIGSLLVMLPVAILSTLQPIGNTGRFKCREDWSSKASEKTFNIFLDVVLLVAPVIIMVLTYTLISETLWQGIRREKRTLENTESKYMPSDNWERDNNGSCLNGGSSGLKLTRTCSDETMASATGLTICLKNGNDTDSVGSKSPRPNAFHQYLRRSNAGKSLSNKKRVIKMLFVVVLEFFICWTPVNVINTLSLFYPKFVYHDVGYMAISFFQLLAYVSSCCNPITYCFMNAKFRKTFLSVFGCRKHPWTASAVSIKTSTLQLQTSAKS